MDGLFSAFLLSLLSGFVLSLSLWHLRFHSIRQNGYFLLFQCTFIGLLLYIIGEVLFIVLSWLGLLLESWPYTAFVTHIGRACWYFFKEVMPQLNQGKEFPVGSYMSLLITLTVTTISIMLELSSRKIRLKADHIALLRDGGALESLLYNSLTQQRYIAVTLKNRKVYVGIVSELPVISGSTIAKPSVQITPFLSGYRNDEMKIVWTRDYEVYHLASKLNEDEYILVPGPGDEEGRVIGYEEAQSMVESLAVCFMIDEISVVSYWSNIEGRIDIVNGRV